MGEVYAIGDASTVGIVLSWLLNQLLTPRGRFGQIETSVVAHLLSLVDECDKNKDGKIDFDEWEAMGQYHF